MIKLIKSTFYNERETKKKLIDFIAGADVLSMGEQCGKFEKNFAGWQGRKFAIMTASGSAANLLVIQALLNSGKIKIGDRIGVSALTWATNVMPLIQLGLRPVAIDCEISTLNISPATLKEKIKDIDALFLTNVLGFSDRIAEITNLCYREGILFIEDNCESLGSKVNGRLLGNFGLASTFSFYVGHHLSTIEGGMVCTDSEKLYEALLMARAHGWDRNLSGDAKQQLRAKYNIDDFYSRYTFYDLAYNVRPTEIQGFLGNEQIGSLDVIINKREANFRRFQEIIKNNSDFLPLDLRHMDVVSNFAMPVICRTKELFEKYKERFKNNGVEIRPIIAGDITKQPFYRKYVAVDYLCPNADFIHRHGFYFPNNPELAEEEISSICSLLVQ